MTLKFRIPESLAGVTLLAFGNGAPDLFASLAASGSNVEEVQDASTSMSLIIGGTLFISTVVASMSTYASNLNPDPDGPPIRMIKVTPKFFLRDITFFILAMLYLLFAVLVVKKINLAVALGMPALYLMFVIVVVI